jgi:hypothetical protein
MRSSGTPVCRLLRGRLSFFPDGLDEPEELPTEAWQDNQTMDFFEYELNAGSTLATADAGGRL